MLLQTPFAGRLTPDTCLSFIMPLLDRFRSRLSDLALVPGPAVVAVSGGPDSVALLDLLVATHATHQLDLVVAHVDHGMHSQSAAQADRVVEVAAAYGLRCVMGRLALGAAATETEARGARYEWLERTRRELGANVILTAHHADDQAETVLMRLLKGSGPAGLAAMSSRIGVIVRPLLPFRRRALVRYLQSRGLRSFDDPANRDERHLRSWLRHVVLPIIRTRLPDVEDRLCLAARQARADRGAWDALLDQLPGLNWRPEAEGSSVAGSALRAYDSLIQAQLLMAVARRSGAVIGLRRALRVAHFLGSAMSGARLDVGGGWRIEVAFDRVHFLRPSAGAQVVDAPLALSGQQGIERWGNWRLEWRPETAPPGQHRESLTAWFSPAQLTVRAWQPGDRVAPLKGRGHRLVVRCFQEARVPRSRRKGWPVVTAGQAVLWVPGVCRSGEQLPVGGSEAMRVDVAHA